MTSLAPIGLFVYRRPDHTRRTLEALQRDPLAARSDLVIFSDAAKTPTHESDVRAVRAVLRESWGFRSLRVVERERNWGLFGSITDGVSQLCAEHGRAIVLEDDILVAPGFLQFMNAGLSRYETDEQVMQVSGYMFPGTTLALGSALFLPIISCWGWATWSRAWQHFDSSLRGIDQLRSDAKLRRRFDIDGTYDYFAMACQQERGEIDSWGICWQLSTFMRNGLVLYPSRSLTQNHGVDGSGTHGKGHSGLHPALGAERRDLDSLRFPDRIGVDPIIFDQVKRTLVSIRPGVLRRLVNWIHA